MRCFILMDKIAQNLKKAIEVTDIEYNSKNHMVKCLDNKTGNILRVNAEDIIIIDNENEMNIFREEYDIL